MRPLISPTCDRWTVSEQTQQAGPENTLQVRRATSISTLYTFPCIASSWIALCCYIARASAGLGSVEVAAACFLRASLRVVSQVRGYMSSLRCRMGPWYQLEQRKEYALKDRPMSISYVGLDCCKGFQIREQLLVVGQLVPSGYQTTASD